MSDKFYEQDWFEQWIGHGLGLGLVGGYIFGPLMIPFYIAREFTKFNIGKWQIGQWPPKTDREPLVGVSLSRYGTPYEALKSMDGTVVDGWHLYLPESRVKDMVRDISFMLSFFAVAQLARDLTPMIWF